MTPRYDRDHTRAFDHAATRSDQNQAPTAVLVRDGWYFVAETTDELEDAEGEGWSVVTLVEDVSL